MPTTAAAARVAIVNVIAELLLDDLEREECEQERADGEEATSQ
jgi:hypothetical protein